MRLDLDHEPSAHNFVVILIEELKHKSELRKLKSINSKVEDFYFEKRTD